MKSGELEAVECVISEIVITIDVSISYTMTVGEETFVELFIVCKSYTKITEQIEMSEGEPENEK